MVSQWTDYDPWGLELSGLSSGSNTNRLKFNVKEALAELGSGLLDFGARLYDATNGRWGVPDPLAEVNRRFSPFVYGNNNPVRMIDPDGMETTDYNKQGIEYSDGYSTQNSRNTTSFISFEGAYQDGGGNAQGGEEPIKGGGFPKGEIRSTVQQNAVIRPANGLRQTEVEEASQLGVNIAWTVEGGASLLKLAKWFKSLVSFSKAVQESALATEGASSALRQVGSVLESVQDVMANPSLLQGKPVGYVRGVLKNSEGWAEGTLTKGRSTGQGWTFRQMNSRGTDFTDLYIQYSPGSPRHFGGSPYWKVSSGNGGTQWFPAK